MSEVIAHEALKILNLVKPVLADLDRKVAAALIVGKHLGDGDHRLKMEHFDCTHAVLRAPEVVDAHARPSVLGRFDLGKPVLFLPSHHSKKSRDRMLAGAFFLEAPRTVAGIPHLAVLFGEHNGILHAVDNLDAYLARKPFGAHPAHITVPEASDAPRIGKFTRRERPYDLSVELYHDFTPFP